MLSWPRLLILGQIRRQIPLDLLRSFVLQLLQRGLLVMLHDPALLEIRDLWTPLTH